VVGGWSRVVDCETLMPCVEGGCGVGMYVSGGGRSREYKWRASSLDNGA